MLLKLLVGKLRTCKWPMTNIISLKLCKALCFTKNCPNVRLWLGISQMIALLKMTLFGKRVKIKFEPSRVSIFLPECLVSQVSQEAHGRLLSGHDGIYKTKECLLQCYYWLGMDANISNTFNIVTAARFAKKTVSQDQHWCLLCHWPLSQTNQFMPTSLDHSELQVMASKWF